MESKEKTTSVVKEIKRRASLFSKQVKGLWKQQRSFDVTTIPPNKESVFPEIVEISQPTNFQRHIHVTIENGMMTGLPTSWEIMISNSRITSVFQFILSF